ncbi:MAG: PDZ domain-containing protein [Firmicutes bacterium]|nr:PDZ domain-containing protein [Bacillota bacterium]
MPPIWEIVRAYLETIGYFLRNPIFWVVLALIGLQYRRSEKMERNFLGRARQPLLGRVLLALVFGLVGGLIGSLLLMGVWITISIQSTRDVLLGSLALALINMRFICFAYSGGLLSLVSLIFGWPQLDVASLMALVAVLHCVESVLMLLSGHLNAFPVTVRQPSGRLVGGYSMQMFWPLPLLALVFVPELSGVVTGDGIAMPHWWPLFRPPGAENLADLTLYMLPLLAGLGYGDLAITMPPKEKARHSAVRLLAYSGILLYLAWLGSRVPALLPLAAVFAPFGHELLIVIANQRQQVGTPLYAHAGPGLKIMEVLPGGLAEQAGLQPFDIILTANGELLHSHQQLYALVQSQPQVVLSVRRGPYTSIVPLVLPLEGGANQLGILLVPDQEAGSYVETRFKSPLQPLLEWWQRG